MKATMEFKPPMPARRRKRKRPHWTTAAMIVPLLLVTSHCVCEATAQKSTYHVRRSLAQNVDLRQEEDGRAAELVSYLPRRIKASKSSDEIPSASTNRSGKISKQAKLSKQSHHGKRKGARESSSDRSSSEKSKSKSSKYTVTHKSSKSASTTDGHRFKSERKRIELFRHKIEKKVSDSEWLDKKMSKIESHADNRSNTAAGLKRAGKRLENIFQRIKAREDQTTSSKSSKSTRNSLPNLFPRNVDRAKMQKERQKRQKKLVQHRKKRRRKKMKMSKGTGSSKSTKSSKSSKQARVSSSRTKARRPPSDSRSNSSGSRNNSSGSRNNSPTRDPASASSDEPTISPTIESTSLEPTRAPAISSEPGPGPVTDMPTSPNPTSTPTMMPVTSPPTRAPALTTPTPSTPQPTSIPTVPDPDTQAPVMTSLIPTADPTNNSTDQPSNRPTTLRPTSAPSVRPTSPAPIVAPSTPNPTTEAPTTSSPTSSAPTRAPTAPPTLSREGEITQLAISLSGEAAITQGTPQNDALVFVRDEDPLALDMPEDEERIVQRYSFMTNYFSLEVDVILDLEGLLAISEDECDWGLNGLGVRCNDDGEIISINFGDPPSPLTGFIAPEIGELTALEELVLNDNEIIGLIPDELQFLDELTILRLEGNNLEGQIPQSFGRLASLREMYVQENDSLVGSMPIEVCGLRNANGGLLTVLEADCAEPNPTLDCVCCTQCY